VIGGRERWERRLDGLAERYRLALAEQRDSDLPGAGHIEAELSALESLRAYALPLLDALAELPGPPEQQRWGVWLDALSALATRALRRPERVLSVLAELAPMAEVGPVGLGEVRLVLAERLLELAEPSPASRHGRVFIASTDAARGLEFDVVAIPGLAERLFPRKISEEPLLLDRQRALLDASLETNDERVAGERLALRIAAGAAGRALLLSYPRLDLDQSRPRVPSFYALEALRAAEGKLPGFDELAGRAERVSGARVGWPAPDDPERAIDAAEHDLALLERLLALGEEQSVGTARYLLTANPHLGRALRFRARRWLPGWTEADGLLPHVHGELAAGAREAMQEQQLAARSYSATALQHFASCPYRFFLQAVHRLAPREEPEAIDEIEPLQRGSLVHDVQFELFGRLAEAGLLPVTPDNLSAARAILDPVLDAVAERYRDDLAPAIDRVWDDGVAAVRADLREWLQRASADTSGFVPWRFELSFGLSAAAARQKRDPHSLPEAVALDCGVKLRGSIDLVERRSDGALRVTDHKTGRARVKHGEVIAGGSSLQPVLYALASEKLFPEADVRSGRLYYCTSAGGFDESDVPLDDGARAAAGLVARVVDGALREPFLPAAPAAGACRFCDYQLVCGPYEEQRTARKWPDHDQIKALRELREADEPWRLAAPHRSSTQRLGAGSARISLPRCSSRPPREPERRARSSRASCRCFGAGRAASTGSRP
jgi:RecB family exonuclease